MAPPGDDRDGGLDGSVYQRAGLAGVGWKGDGRRRDLVNRRVSRVKLACQIIEGDFTVRTSERRLLLGRNHRATAVYRRRSGLTMAITIR